MQLCLSSAQKRPPSICRGMPTAPIRIAAAGISMLQQQFMCSLSSARLWMSLEGCKWLAEWRLPKRYQICFYPFGKLHIMVTWNTELLYSTTCSIIEFTILIQLSNIHTLFKSQCFQKNDGKKLFSAFLFPSFCPIPWLSPPPITNPRPIWTFIALWAREVTAFRSPTAEPAASMASCKRNHNLEAGRSGNYWFLDLFGWLSSKYYFFGGGRPPSTKLRFVFPFWCFCFESKVLDRAGEVVYCTVQNLGCHAWISHLCRGKVWETLPNTLVLSPCETQICQIITSRRNLLGIHVLIRCVCFFWVRNRITIQQKLMQTECRVFYQDFQYTSNHLVWIEIRIPKLGHLFVEGLANSNSELAS